MRDTDCDLSSLVAVRVDSPVRALADLRGRVVATAAVDSPQATLLPLALLRGAGLHPDENGDVRVRRFDVGVGLHGITSAGSATRRVRWPQERSTRPA
jgi:phosphonate transport system substrate-binding protein